MHPDDPSMGEKFWAIKEAYDYLKNESEEVSFQQSKNIDVEITLSFLEAIKGTEREVKIERDEICTKCKGMIVD